MDEKIVSKNLTTVVEESYCDDNSWVVDPDDTIDSTVTGTNYTLIESGSVASKHSRKSSSRSAFKNFKAASSLSISMLAKPSDDRKSNTFFAGWNVSTLIQGTGTLGIPYAVRQGGWVSVAMIFFVSILCCHTGKLIVECMYEKSKKTGICRRLRTNYPELAQAVMGRKGFVVSSIFILMEMYGASIMFIIILGTTWQELFGSYIDLNKNQWAAINCAIVFPTLFITKMSYISWFSMISVFALLSSLLTLITFSVFHFSSWSINNIPTFDAQTFPVGFGIVVFSYCAHAIFPGVEGSMKKPQQFNPMMNISFLLAAIMKALLGTFMVLTFGGRTEEVATLNLEGSPIFSTLATSLITCSVLCVLPLEMYIVNETIDDGFLKYFPRVNKDSRHHWIWVLTTRTTLLSLALGLAILVPHFGLLMGVIGNFSGSFLCFIFPCYFHLKLRKDSLTKFDIFSDVAIIVFGVLAGGTGLVFTTKALVMTYLQ